MSHINVKLCDKCKDSLGQVPFEHSVFTCQNCSNKGKDIKSDSNQYIPWEELNVSETEYWKQCYLLSQQELKTAQDMILNLFIQATYNNGLYDHSYISTYEHAQDYLLEEGLITEAECYRK